VTPSVVITTEDKGSSKLVLTEEKGKGPAKVEEAKMAIEDDTSLGEGPFDQVIGGWRYRVHHTARKIMGAKKLAKAVGFTEQLGYPSGSLFFGVGKMLICTASLTTWRRMCHAIWSTMLAFRS
jgi:hypothetical protein